MVSVQSAGCAPIVRAFEEGARHAEEFPNAETVASGLRVPKAIGDFLILDVREIGAAEGVFVAPEGAACLPALRKLIERGDVGEDERVVLFNTGAGVKYLEAFGG